METADGAAADAPETSSSSSADELQVQNWLLTLRQDEESSVREAGSGRLAKIRASSGGIAAPIASHS
jgi:hypothetical protein